MKIKKSVSFALLSSAILIILLPTYTLACACCADEGYYKLSVRKPADFEKNELKRLSFHDSKLYSTPAYPDDIKGLDPIGEDYNIDGTINGDNWSFTLTDNQGKTGTLKLKTPRQIVDFAVDTRNGNKAGAGSVLLYKEWRFKNRVSEATGIFKDAAKGKTEYFLVLQGKGNVCTSADDFTHWRLEVTGKKANYTFYGTTKANTNSADLNRKTNLTSNPQKPFKASSNSAKQDLIVGNLVGKNYFGCGCSGFKRVDNKRGDSKTFFWSEWKEKEADETVIFNINGKDTEFNLIKKGKRPEKEKVGDRFEDEYEGNGLKIILSYITQKLPCEECEGTDYQVTATIIGKFEGKVITMSGSCGC